jgi:diguanylate cyclase (GGDEF)-like protein
MTARYTRQMAGLLLGVACVVAVTLVRLALERVAGSDMALIFYIVAVLAAAAVGGGVPGIATTAMSLLAGIVFIITPESLAESALEWVRVLVFASEGIAISLTLEQLQRRTRMLRETADQLDAERRHVEAMALEDPLTGLANRRACMRDLDRLLAAASREGEPLTVAVADIDGLKHTNDEYGHERGDELLVAVANALRHSCRASDQAYRIGGDEFVLLLPGTDASGYEAFCSRLGRLLHSATAPFDTTGVSVGAAYAPEDAVEERVLLRLADERMYEVKKPRRSVPARQG